jgi:hypothetical protein
LFRDAGTRGVSAYADGVGAGEYSAHSEGSRFAHAAGGVTGNVDPSVGAIGGRNYVGVGAMSTADSNGYALAMSDGGHRNANVSVYGGVYQGNSAYIDSGFMAGVSGRNQSGASYFGSDSDSYNGTSIPVGTLWVKKHGRNAGIPQVKPFKWHPRPQDRNEWDRVGLAYKTFCRPGMEYASTDGSAFTAGGTIGYSVTDATTSTSFGATGNLAVGNNGVWGNGELQTGAFVSNGYSEAGAFTAGTFNYSGNGFGAGLTYGGGSAVIGDGTASSHSSQTSIATGNNGDGQPN